MRGPLGQSALGEHESQAQFGEHHDAGSREASCE